MCCWLLAAYLIGGNLYSREGESRFVLTALHSALTALTALVILPYQCSVITAAEGSELSQEGAILDWSQTDKVLLE